MINFEKKRIPEKFINYNQKKSEKKGVEKNSLEIFPCSHCTQVIVDKPMTSYVLYRDHFEKIFKLGAIKFLPR